MEKNLVIGEVIKPQGILGEVKVKPYTDDVSRFQSLKEVYVCGETYRVLNARIAQDAVYLSLSGVPDRNAAERLRGKFLEVKRENAAQLAGLGDVTGAVAPGLCADLIVTKDNPLDDLRALRHVELVMANGRLFDQPKFKTNPIVAQQLDRYLTE